MSVCLSLCVEHFANSTNHRKRERKVWTMTGSDIMLIIKNKFDSERKKKKRIDVLVSYKWKINAKNNDAMKGGSVIVLSFHLFRRIFLCNVEHMVRETWIYAWQVDWKKKTTRSYVKCTMKKQNKHRADRRNDTFDREQEENYAMNGFHQIRRIALKSNTLQTRAGPAGIFIDKKEREREARFLTLHGRETRVASLGKLGFMTFVWTCLRNLNRQTSISAERMCAVLINILLKTDVWK